MCKVISITWGIQNLISFETEERKHFLPGSLIVNIFNKRIKKLTDHKNRILGVYDEQLQKAI